MNARARRRKKEPRLPISVLYSGASLNDVYLHQHDKYRYDRYHLIRNRKMSDIMFEWVTQNIMNGRGEIGRAHV